MRSLADKQTALMRALHLDPKQPDAKITIDNLQTSIGALVQLAVVITYANKNGMRGPARDAIAEIVDLCFDVVDDAEARSPEFAATLNALRSAT